MEIPSLASNNPALVLVQAAVQATLASLKTPPSEDQVAISDQAKDRASVKKRP